MSHLVLARKYRPLAFDSVTGQEHVTKTLLNAIKRGKIAHAYLFCGPRGVGKTSIARIFSKALNCAAGKDGPTISPCLECVNCKEIAAGTSMAVREIDGASHNSVDNVRDLIDSFRTLPAPGSRYKVYIIDEVHMLSISAFNALLKSLEEPPPHTVFILATTEVHKIPDTVLSRCQRHDLRAMTQREIMARLQTIAEAEGVSCDEDALRLVARIADGSMRDSQSLMERVIGYADGKITGEVVATVLGVVEQRSIRELSSLVLARRPNEALQMLQNVFASGLDPGLFLKEFVLHWRNMMLLRHAGPDSLRRSEFLEQLGLSTDSAEETLAQVKDSAAADIQDLFELLRAAADEALRSGYLRFAIEAIIVRMATREPVAELAGIIAQLSANAARSSGATGGGTGGNNVNQGSGRSVGQSSTSSSAVRAVAAVQQKSAPQRAQLENDSESPVIVRSQGAGAVTAKTWEEVIQAAGGVGLSRLVVESLRRCGVREFVIPPTVTAAGKLILQGPEFSIKTIDAAEGRAGIIKLLQQQIGCARWELKLEVVAGATAAPGSVAEAEQRARTGAQNKKREELVAHPQVQALQKLFPGSTIEAVVLQDDESR